MKFSLAKLLLLIALVAVGWWGWHILFPNPEAVIRANLVSLAKAASFESSQGTVARLYNAQKVPDYFTADVVINIGSLGFGEVESVNGRDEIQQAVLAARKNWKAMKVELLDIHVTIAPDGQSATANLTGKASVPGEKEFFVQEFNFLLRKVEGKWLIYRVDPVKTLS